MCGPRIALFLALARVSHYPLDLAVITFVFNICRVCFIPLVLSFEVLHTKYHGVGPKFSKPRVFQAARAFHLFLSATLVLGPWRSPRYKAGSRTLVMPKRG